MRFLLIGSLCALVCGATAEAAAGHVLARESQARYVIVVDPDATEPERTAAKELKDHLDQVAGADFPILTGPESLSGDALCLFVGSGERFQSTVQNADSIGPDGIRLLSHGENIYFGGDRPRGTLYAVYTFLEDVVGCRWWTPSEAETPSRPTLTVPPLDVTYTPPVRMRDTLYLHAREPYFAVRNKLNGHFQPIPEAYGGHKRIIGFCHTFFRILPVETYFEAHPEWYSMVDGERVDYGQLCLTNELMRAEFIRNALEWVRQDPDAGMISISQNDGGRRIGRPCGCPECQAVAAEEGSESGPVIRFVNEVSEAIEAQYPGFLVETLAYTYTRRAPRITRPRDNVVIRLCSYECDYSGPIASLPGNSGFMRDLREWSEISNHLYIWNYLANFSNYYIPQPNWDGLAPDIRMYLDHKAIGIFEQGDAFNPDGDFDAMRPWLIAKLLWDPYQDQDELIRTFLDGYYGPAGKYLWEYIQITRGAIANSGIKLGIYMQTTRDWLDPASVFRITELLNQAEAAVAGDPILERRFQAVRLPMDFVWVRRYDELKQASTAQGLPFPGPEAPEPARDAFVAKVAVLDGSTLGEGRPFSLAAPGLRNLYKDHGPVPETLRSRDPADYVYRSAIHMDCDKRTRSAALVADPLSASGYAVRILPDAQGHAARLYIDPGMQGHEVRDTYIRLRVDANAASGHLCNVGIWDLNPGRIPPVTEVNIEDLDPDGYTSVWLPREAFWLGRYVSVEMLDNPETVNAVYVEGCYILKR